MNSSGVSPWRCIRRLNLAHSKIAFFWILKNLFIFPRTCAYLPLSASVRTSSASSPKQYSKVLIGRSSLSPAIPDEMQNCSKHFLHFGHSSELLKLYSQRVAVERWPSVLLRSIQPLLTPCGVVSHLYLRLLLKPRIHNSTSTSIHCYKYWFPQ